MIGLGPLFSPRNVGPRVIQRNAVIVDVFLTNWNYHDQAINPTIHVFPLQIIQSQISYNSDNAPSSLSVLLRTKLQDMPEVCKFLHICPPYNKSIEPRTVCAQRFDKICQILDKLAVHITVRSTRHQQTNRLRYAHRLSERKCWLGVAGHSDAPTLTLMDVRLFSSYLGKLPASPTATRIVGPSGKHNIPHP